MAQHKVLAPQQSAETVTKVTAHLFYTNRPTINVLDFNSMKSTFIKLEGITLFKYRYSRIGIKVEKFIVLCISCTGTKQYWIVKLGIYTRVGKCIVQETCFIAKGKYFRTLHTQPRGTELLSWVSTLELGSALLKKHVATHRASEDFRKFYLLPSSTEPFSWVSTLELERAFRLNVDKILICFIVLTTEAY